MKYETIFENKIIPALIVFAITGCTILWDYFNGGVPTHHLLSREDLPGLSNWWGLLTMPLLTWITLVFVEKRRHLELIDEGDTSNSAYFKNFISALIFGVIISVLWITGFESILQYIILIPIIVALFRPVHFAECLLGFVLGLLYVFGGILPLVFGSVLLLISLIINRVIGKGIRLILSKLISTPT